ncbi:MAG: YihA family ribosome biogenesis GTP-binding protein [Amphibacillus sp.]|uniref:Probable GTP-binding protein EngB n=1 Tax=Amphibacillus xylanus (strain ATCC 51415 / DSM 6626 / JCM 7361 / LMG 17667 / NBRC 15112 / Ep01) TaxID=698758 RepID=K0IXG4_AMPXN|nr:ribosome biogenesis GTP-binding protein YihA/YsxC [Amphibacillus xylanus]NMA89872.1 YihA family ribosome biogenesis GTP-binding protein [Amphibacillus sp.]BAM47125.1 GTPase [Amphibacillus xylanus NBRC 15112]
MKVTQSEFTISAVSPNQYPTENLPEIALAGRSNVGKSSFINKMINRKALARTSSKPGKTQTLNYYLINEFFYFVDVPGYGYAKVSKTEREAWGKMMETYFSEREPLRATILVVDIRHKPTNDDVMMYDFLKHYDIPVIIIATKLDKIKKGQVNKQVKLIKETLSIEPGDQVIPFSSETAQGKEAAWNAIQAYLA